ncbi:VWA domain-containing protein [Aeromonas sanarellii]|uniref:VWA domain-containing protein n=1 Tax=Aeromonas sanarellii TaxID=633415 RepID=UPI0039899B87
MTSSAADLQIRIMDDTPLAVNDAGGEITEDEVGSLNGNVLSNDAGGADTAASLVGWSASGHDNTDAVNGLNLYGTFTQNADGSWTYALDNSRAATQALTSSFNQSYDVWYTMQDADGDVSIAKLTITINGANDSQNVTVQVAGGENSTVYETALVDGRNELSDPASNSDEREAVSGTFTVNATDGVASITVLGNNFVPGGVLPQDIDTGYGLLDITSVTLSPDGKSATVGYTYTLSDNVLTPPAGIGYFDDIGNFITVTGVSGMTSSAADLQIRIVDDTPSATDEAVQTVTEGATQTGAFDFVAGADGAGVSHINGALLTFGADGYSQVLDVGNGTIKVKADGSYSYTADVVVNNSSVVTDSFTFTVTDKDGDAVTKSASFNITDINVPVGGLSTAMVDDDGLSGGNSASTSGDLVVTPDLDNNEATFSGTLAFNSGGDGVGSVNFANMHNTTGTVGQETVAYSWNGSNNTLTATSVRGALFTVVVNPATGAYTVTLLSNVLHATLNGQSGDDTENDAVTTLTYTVKDADNSSVTGTLTLTFDDDMPSATDEALQSVVEGATKVGTFDFVAGADGAGVSHINDIVLTFGADGYSQVLDVGSGKIKVKADGSYSYTADAAVNNNSTVTDSLTFTVTDKDGDAVTRTATFGVTDTGITNVSASNEVVDEDDIVGGNAGNAGGPGDDAPVTSGHISYTLGADALQSITLSVASTGLTKLDGTVVQTSWDAGTRTLTGYGTGIGDVVFKIVLGNPTSTGVDYNVTLFQVVKHPLTNDPSTQATETAFEDNLGFTVNVEVKDVDNSTGNTSFTVSIDDDSPIAVNDTITSGTAGTVNLILVLDSSGSIGDANMQVIKDAVTNLMNSYGNSLVRVMLVDFDDTATVKSVSGQVWLTKDQATGQLISISSGGSTDYDDALDAVRNNYGTPPAADNTFVFFISDGVPNPTSDGVDSGERSTWTNFLTQKGIDGAYAVGIGSASVLDSDLQSVAWSPSGAHNSNVVVINAANQLSGTLTNLAQAIEGNVTTNDSAGADGFGSPRMVSVVYNNTTYTFNGSNTSFTISLGANKGTLYIENDGDYKFTPPPGGAEGAPVEVIYTIKDADGDNSTAKLTIINPVLVIGSNANDSGAGSSGTADDHTRPNPTFAPDVDGEIIGGVAADVLVGDVGGVTSGSYNLTFMIDRSGSISTSEFNLMKAAINDLLSKFIGITQLRIEIGTFGDSSAQVGGTYTTVADAQAAINALTPGNSNTNYEAALKTLNTMVANDPAADKKIIYFLTDGEPTSGAWQTTATIAAGMSTLSHLSDAATAVNHIEINAVGIGLPGGSAPGDNLNAIDNTANGYLPVDSFDDLAVGLGSLFTAVSVGNDNLTGGAGNDVIFGDSIYADNADGGWFEFLTNNPGKTGAQLLSEIYNQHGQYGKEGSVGGNDILDGGTGDDILYGQKGNDILNGGDGVDLLIGGTGSDTLTGGAGKDTFKWQSGDAGGTDTIKDFTTGANGDVLDLSELLSGEHSNAANLDQYLTFASGPGSNKSTLTIDVDGSGSGSTTHTIFFDNVDLTANSTRTDQQIIQDLLNQGNLKVDP